MNTKNTPANLVLWSDDQLLVIDKPAGILSLPHGYDPSQPTLQTLLEPVYGRVFMVHRLDRDTSGVMLVARTKEAHREINQQFTLRRVIKDYIAIAIGSPSWDLLEINDPLLVDGDRRHRTVVDLQRGKPAQTTVTILARSGGFSLISARPHTGYTHQIRAHLNAHAIPIYADPLYKPRNHTSPLVKLPIQRLALHARGIQFTHPQSGELLSYAAPYPDDFQRALKTLAIEV